MATKTQGPIELVRIETGRYLWDDAKEQIDFIPRGERKSVRTLHTHSAGNTYNGAMRVVARDLMRMHPGEE
jgi:hypothetical protein